jgi:hypothetical protein
LAGRIDATLSPAGSRIKRSSKVTSPSATLVRSTTTGSTSAGSSRLMRVHGPRTQTSTESGTSVTSTRSDGLT